MMQRIMHEMKGRTRHGSMRTSGLLSASLAGFLSIPLLFAQAPAQAPTADDPQVATEAVAGVRIVRLSQAEGKVMLDRGIHRGFEAAFTNLPITQGALLKTEDTSLAEVEFEDNSSLRLTPNTIVQFAQLTRSASGSTASSVNVIRGTVYISLTNSKDNLFTVASPESRMTLAPASHIQVHVGPPQSSVSVFTGAVQAQTGLNSTIVQPKKSLLFEPGSQAAPTLVSHVQKNVFDDWDKDAVQFHKQLTNASFMGGAGTGAHTAVAYPAYGLSDLNYYGSFSDVGGCGSLWRPYFASASWDPYGNGAWALYQGGYSWVSPYPWGWTPFHSGSWQYCPSAGWGWQPGGNFVGLNNAVLIGRRPTATHPVGPPRLPKGGGSLIEVKTQPLIISKQNGGSFVFRNDSAGLGIPRETFGKLSRASTNAVQHGSATVTLYSASAATASSNMSSALGTSNSVRSSSFGSTTMDTSHASPGVSAGSSGRTGGGGASSGGGHH